LYILGQVIKKRSLKIKNNMAIETKITRLALDDEEAQEVDEGQGSDGNDEGGASDDEAGADDKEDEEESL
jgi:hypothetical protein